MNLERKLLEKGKKYLRTALGLGAIGLISLLGISCGDDDESSPTSSSTRRSIIQEQKEETPPTETSTTSTHQVNRPPKITSTPPTEVEENENYHYRIKAEDADGDILNYRLLNCPDWLSVTIDRIQGRAPEVEVDTTIPITIRASDSKGGTTDQKYNLRVRNAQNTQELSTEDLREIQDIDETSITFEDPIEFSQGDVIVGGISDKTPYGILRKVTEISQNRRTVKTEQATLEEALIDGSLSFRRELSQQDAVSYKALPGASKAIGSGFGFSIDLEDVNLSIDSKNRWVEQGLVANGNISFNIEPLLEVEVKRLRLERMVAQVIMEENVNLELSSNMALGTRGIEKEIMGYYLTPIPIPGTPFVITPKIDVDMVITPGKLNQLQMGINQQASLSPGVAYKNRGWENLSDFSNSFDFWIQETRDGTDLEVYAHPSIKLFINGILPGAKISIGSGLRLESSGEDEWELYGGLRAGVGIDMNVFSRFVGDHNVQVISSERLLKRAGESTPPNKLEGNIVFARNDGESAEIMTMETDGSNQTNLTQTNTEWEINPSWSPDGRFIFFSKTRKTGRDVSYNIYRMNSNGSEEIQITRGSEHKDKPTLSPNGQLIAYRVGLRNSQIHVARANGIDPTNITRDPQNTYENPSWSPTEEIIAFESDRSRGESKGFIRDIFTMRKDGSRIKRLTYDEESRQPSWSPDGELIAFSSNREGNWEIYVMRSNGNNPRNISNSPNTNERYPSWSPDQSNIVYTSLPAGSSSGKSEEIWIMDYPTGLNKRQLTKNSHQDSQPDWF